MEFIWTWAALKEDLFIAFAEQKIVSEVSIYIEFEFCLNRIERRVTCVDRESNAFACCVHTPDQIDFLANISLSLSLSLSEVIHESGVADSIDTIIN